LATTDVSAVERVLGSTANVPVAVGVAAAVAAGVVAGRVVVVIEVGAGPHALTRLTTMAPNARGSRVFTSLFRTAITPRYERGDQCWARWRDLDLTCIKLVHATDRDDRH